MKSAFATTWKRSVQPRKQRKYVHNAPAHTKSKMVSAHLSKDLKEKHGTRSVRVRVGDKVKVVRGSEKGKEGKVEQIDVNNTLIYVAKVERTKPEGGKVPIGLHPSKVVVTELILEDKKRKAKLEQKETKVSSASTKSKQKE